MVQKINQVAAFWMPTDFATHTTQLKCGARIIQMKKAARTVGRSGLYRHVSLLSSAIVFPLVFPPFSSSMSLPCQQDSMPTFLLLLISKCCACSGHSRVDSQLRVDSTRKGCSFRRWKSNRSVSQMCMHETLLGNCRQKDFYMHRRKYEAGWFQGCGDDLRKVQSHKGHKKSMCL